MRTGDHLLQSDSPAEGLTTRCWATYGNAISRDCYRAPAKCLQHPAKGLVESNATLWTLFLLQCCAHHDDGDSLGNDDDLVRLNAKKRGIPVNQQNNTNNRTAPPKQTTRNQTTNQNTGSPTIGETVKQNGSQ